MDLPFDSLDPDDFEGKGKKLQTRCSASRSGMGFTDICIAFGYPISLNQTYRHLKRTEWLEDKPLLEVRTYFPRKEASTDMILPAWQ